MKDHNRCGYSASRAKAWGAEKIANMSNWHVHIVCREKGQGIIGNRARSTERERDGSTDRAHERREGKGSGLKQVES